MPSEICSQYTEEQLWLQHKNIEPNVYMQVDLSAEPERRDSENSGEDSS
jgi:hypothetical protein